MSFSKVNAELIYEIIHDSVEIQELIRNIVNSEQGTMVDSNIGISKKKNKDLENYEKYRQLQREIIELRQYKEVYEKVRPKLQRYESLDNEVNLLQRERMQNRLDLEQKESKIRKLNNEIDECNNIIERLKSENAALLSDISYVKNELASLKTQFETPVKYLSLYRSLSDRVRNGLENVIRDTNEITFIASCSNESNLSSVWEYIKEISNDSESQDYKNLSKIFEYCFEIFNQSLPEPKYQMDNVEVGDEFDDDYYDRSFGSSTSGQITKVILRGYKSRNTGKIIHKSLVSV